jgi:hypothetical protein
MINYKVMAWEEMAQIVYAIYKEMKRRNPIGVNLYAPTVKYAALLLDEIARAETTRCTCEAGPGTEKELR